MVRKLSLSAILLLLLPTLALAVSWKISFSGGTGGLVTPVTQSNLGGYVYVPQTSPATTVKFKAAPNFGYKVDTVLFNAAPVIVGSDGYYAVTPTANSTLKATFTKSVGLVTAAVATKGPTTMFGLGSGSSLALTGSFTVSPIGTPYTTVTYTWSTPSGHLTSLSGPTTSFYADSFGTYAVTLVVIVDGKQSAPVTSTIKVTSEVVNNSQSCIYCHSARNATIVNAYSKSSHVVSNSGPTCQACHNTGLALPHPGTRVVTAAVCESCHAATLSTTTHPVALTASKCLGCHDSHDPAAEIPALRPSNHPAVTLYTFEEIGMQMAGGQKVPVQVDASGKGMPYSPKQTCGTSGCHVINGTDYTYDKISDHAFHSNQGRSQYVDSSDGKFNATKAKPWTQSTAMVGKW